MSLALCIDGAYAPFAGSVRRLLDQRLLGGTIYVGLGVGLLLNDRKA